VIARDSAFFVHLSSSLQTSLWTRVFFLHNDRWNFASKGIGKGQFSNLQSINFSGKKRLVIYIYKLFKFDQIFFLLKKVLHENNILILI
jgi:hypothetical protein